MASRVLVFSLGQGGYDVAFASAVESQREYCKRHGYSYVCVSQDGSPALGRENIWLKTLLLYGALLKNDYVLYMDTDVGIQPGCPPLHLAVSNDKPIGVVAGHSGRVNAGVIFACRNSVSLDFFAKWVASLGKPISGRHDVGWGENGHLIRLVEEYGVIPIDTRWNNTFDPGLDDYIRHYTGPLRNEYRFEGESKLAWDEILAALSHSKTMDDADILTSFAELKEVYERSAPTDCFAPFDQLWTIPKDIAFPQKYSSLPDKREDFHLYVAEDVQDSSPNAYVVTLRDGLQQVLGPDNVTTGVASFWDHAFEPGDILHIEWIESLFYWKVPSDEQVQLFEQRMAQIATSCPILYTAHNFDLMPTYGKNRGRLMQALADHATVICHLSPDNIEPYARHHAKVKGLKDVKTAIVPHGDYQPYFRLDNQPFKDRVFESDKIKILVFGHIRTEKELKFCLDVGEELGHERYQMIFAGAIHPDLIHWKEIHRYRDEWDGRTRRIHFKVPNEQVISLVSQCDALLVPRFDRLNSGVQFLGHSMLKPVFVPDQNSMGDVQKKAEAGGIFIPEDLKSAVSVIKQTFEGDPVARMVKRFKVNAFNYSKQDPFHVGKAHEAAYQLAIAEHATRQSEVVS
ncbi:MULTISPECIES: hypothetical protein [unclassified Sphingobium]|uniref:hypothetical protein n=1 Tax=unclassified Sphingobium TaxID=2611147 RepID=UPI000D15D7EE|nr:MULTISPECIES: hypothetical protein [unclassified Sphingobium]PSO09728.1 hypothetical protein C7E20_21120 [Sphingobium sp. AEW4]TWD19052.1 glycosyltransferase involved in cell wall biosynthesis [Sphingobium sp. AEW013]